MEADYRIQALVADRSQMFFWLVIHAELMLLMERRRGRELFAEKLVNRSHRMNFLALSSFDLRKVRVCSWAYSSDSSQI